MLIIFTGHNFQHCLTLSIQIISWPVPLKKMYPCCIFKNTIQVTWKLVQTTMSDYIQYRFEKTGMLRVDGSRDHVSYGTCWHCFLHTRTSSASNEPRLLMLITYILMARHHFLIFSTIAGHPLFCVNAHDILITLNGNSFHIYVSTIAGHRLQDMSSKSEIHEFFASLPLVWNLWIMGSEEGHKKRRLRNGRTLAKLKILENKQCF